MLIATAANAESSTASLDQGSARTLGRREMILRSAGLAAALGVPAELFSACGSGGSASSWGTLTVGATDWLPDDFYVKNSLGAGLLAWTQMAWPLFLGAGSGFAFRNGLAASYEVSEDGLTHTIGLRPAMTFHSGRPIEADAVAENLRASFFPDAPLHEGTSAYIQTLIFLGEPPIISAVEVADKRTIQLRLSAYRQDLRTDLAVIPILDPEVLGTKGYGTDSALLGEGGSGPFRLKRFEPGDSAEFVAYPGFFEPVTLERILLRSITDPGSLAVALQAGEIDVASGLAKADYDAAVSSGYNPITAAPCVNVDLVFSNFKDRAFRDPRVREAFALAMNRGAYARNFFNAGTARESTQPIVPPGLPGYVKDIEPRPHDVAKARQLLAEAGYEAPEITLTVPSARAPISSTKNLAEAIAADAGEAGFKVKIEILDGLAYYERLEGKQVEAFIEGPGAGPEILIVFDLYFSYPEYQPGPLPEYPQITSDLAQAHATRSAEQRDQLLRKIVATTTEATLMVPIAVADYCAIANSGVENFTLSTSQIDSWNKVTVGS
jgi:peptide/nickel transport system substrate-binding protein